METCIAFTSLRGSPTAVGKAKLVDIYPASVLRRAALIASFPMPPKSPSMPLSNPSPDAPKRSRLESVTDLVLLPFTPREWKRAMADVKVLYLKGQYKRCSSLCNQILDGIRDLPRVHPLYSIYLSFYAASSLELTARSLHNGSCIKLPLLQESLAQYENAAAYIEYASFRVDPNLMHATRPSSFHSSTSSSIRSSVDSVFSQDSSSPPMSSPTSSFYSSTSNDSPFGNQWSACSLSPYTNSDDDISPLSLRSRKRTQFSLSLPPLIPESSDDLTSSETTPTKPKRRMKSTFSNFRTYPPPPCPSFTPYPLTKYRQYLTSFSTQLQYHISDTNHAISTHNTTPQKPSPRPTGGSFKKSKRASVDSLQGDDPVKRAELHSRIQRLRERGWKRSRFDGERYRVLCETALGELDGRRL